MLKFTGVGSDLNPELGSTSAFIRLENEGALFMIDCGETTYRDLLELNLLNGVRDVHILITHFHPDHVAGLGSVITHMHEMYMSPEPDVKIYFPDGDAPIRLLDSMNIHKDQYTVKTIEVDKPFEILGVVKATPISVPHDDNLDSYGYIVEHENRIAYYSGDSREIPDKILSLIIKDELDAVYQDVSTYDYEGNTHLPLDKLVQIVPKSLKIRFKIYCMHLDKAWSEETARKLGFRIAKRHIKQTSNHMLPN